MRCQSEKSQIFTKLLLVICMLMGSFNLHALDLTVGDGTATNGKVPLYGLYNDERYQQSQTIYPASMLSAMQGQQITKLTYFLSSSAGAAWTSTIEVRLGTTTTSSFASGTCNMLSGTTFTNQTLVYSGTLDATGTTMDITLSTPYTYSGGNLVVDVRVVTLGNYKSAYFYGVSNSSYYSVRNEDEDSTPPYASGEGTDFMPKVKFTYGDSGSGGGDDPGDDGCTTENFSGVTATAASTDGNVPTGWKAFAPEYSGTAGYVPHVSTASYASMDGNYLFMKADDDCNSVYAIMPKYQNMENASFKYRYEDASQGTLTLGYVTANTSAGCSNFVTLTTLSATTTSTTYTLTAAQINTVNSANGYIAFKWNCTSSLYYSSGIDDVNVCTGNGGSGGDLCTPTWDDSSEGYIAKFEVLKNGSTIFTSSSTGTENSNTNYYDTRSFTVSAGDQIGFSITPSISDTYGFAVWIDLDNDGLESSDKVLGTTTYESSFTNQLYTIPAATAPGEYRVRILQDWGTGAPTDPCGNDYYAGESEDYKMIVEAQGQYSITCANVTGGTVTASQNYANVGQTITVTATPYPGYTLTSLSYTTTSGTTTTITGNSFTMPASNVTVTAVFTANTSYSITYNAVPAAGGTVTGAASAPWGSTVNVTVSTNAGYSLQSLTYTANGVTTSIYSGSFTMPQANVTVTATFEETTADLIIDDRESHDYSYFSAASPIHSLNPMDISIEYDGNGVAYGVDNGTNAISNILYYETLENSKADGSGYYYYTTIPGFSGRPIPGAFTGWKVMSISSGMTVRNASTGTAYTTGNIIPAETKLRITTTNSYDDALANKLSLKADWSGTLNVQNVSSQSGLESALANITSGDEYSNFIVVTSNITLSITSSYKTTNTAPVTITTYAPNGTNYNKGITCDVEDYNYYWGPVKFESIKLSFYEIVGYSNVLIFGRNITTDNTYVAQLVTLNQVFPGTSYSSITLSDCRFRIESGAYKNVYGFDGYYNDTYNSLTITNSFTYNCTIGNDFDRVKGVNSRVSIANYMASNYTYFSQYNTFNTYVKSGTVTSWLYLGINRSGDPTYRYNIIEGGDIAELAGGYVECSSASQESMFMRVKGGRDNNAVIRGGVYGAAQHVDDIGKVTMVFTGGNVEGWIAGGCNGTETDGGTLDGNTYLYVGGKTNVNSNGNTSIIDGSSSLGGMVYGAGSGIEGGTTVGQVNNSTVVIADNAYIERNVYGGGNYGFVASGGATNIHILGSNVAGSVFGGSNEQVGQTVNLAMTNGTVNGNVYGGSNTKGTINNAATLAVSGGTIKGNLFGGGCGANTSMASSVTVNVSDSAYIVGHVFGGGELGSSVSSVVNIMGGKVGGNVFGGALGTSGTVKMTGNKTVNMLGGIVSGSVYGGSRNANDTKDSYVNISGGIIDKNVYGGGFYGSITGNTFVNIGKNAVVSSANGSTGGAAGQVVSGSNTSSYVPFHTSYCDYGSKGEFIIPASYMQAAGITSGTQLKSLTLTQQEGKEWVAKNLIVKMLNTSLSAYSSTGFLADNGTVVYSAASYSANSNAQIVITFSSNFTYTGGGLIVQFSCENGGTWKSSTWLGVTTTTNQSYYGYNSTSSSTGYTSGNTLQTFLPNIAFGTSGSSSSTVAIAGGTNSDKIVPATVDQITIGESVYAGSDWGEFTAGGSFMDANISGVSNIFIDGLGYEDGKLKIGNSIYGSGTSGDAGATAHDIVVRNLGTYSGNGNASYKLYTIQRAGHIVLDNTHIEFLGKGDIVSPTVTKTYSMLNIDKNLIVTNASSLVLNAPIEQLHAMGSYSCTNAYTLDTVAVNYNGLDACDNKIFFDNGCFVNVNYDNNGASTYGRLTGFFHATASSGHSGFAFARPKVNNNSGDAAYAGWSAYAPLNVNDGGFVSYTASENTFNAVGGNATNGVQIPYKHHPTNRDDSQFYRVWMTGEGTTENDVVITAEATGSNYNIITATATTEWPRISSNDGCSYYRITNIEWSDAAQFVNAGIYNNVPQYGHIYYDGNDITLSYGQTAAQCSDEINAINANPNYTFGLTMIPKSNVTFVNTDNTTIPAIVLSEDGEEYYSTTGHEIKMTPDGNDLAKAEVTFMLTYSNGITSTQSFSPVILTIEEVDCTTGNVLMTMHQNINIQTSTKIQDVEATVYARMYGTGPTHDSTTVKVVLPTWTLTSGEEYSTLTVQNITNTPVATGATRHAATYFNTNTGTTNDFGMTYKPAKENDNTLGWSSSHYLDYYFDNHTVALPEMLGTADGREQIAITFTVHYNGQAYHNEAEDELSKQIYRVKMTNYEGSTKEFDITIHIRRRGQAQNWYISSTGSNANNGQYPDKPKRSVKAIQTGTPSYVTGDNIFVVGAVNVNAPSEWDGSQYGNDMRIYRYPGKHKLSDGSTDGNNPYLGTMFNINSELHTDYAFIDGMYGCNDANLNPGGNLTITAQGPVFNVSNDGTLILHNSSIRNNRVVSTTENAGAVNMGGDMIVDDLVVIDNNYLNSNLCNVFLVEADSKIGIENALDDNALIGVTKTAFPAGSPYTPVAYSIEENNAIAAETYNEGYVFADNESDLYYNATATEYTNPYTIYLGSSDVYETACDNFEWNGTTYTTSGDYTYVDPISHQASTLHLNINNSSYRNDVQVACDSFTWIDGVIYTQSNNTATFVIPGGNQFGCDSIITLDLTINESQTAEYTETACDSYPWHGTTYTTSGDYTYETTTTDGCTLTETLHLTINESQTAEYTEAACDSYQWHGTTYTTSGDYTYETTTAEGCTLTETLHLTISESQTAEYTETACDSYQWHGSNYTTSGDFNYETTTSDDCTLVETLHLTINKSEAQTYNVTECDGYTWHGTTYDQSGIYTYNTTTAAGCERVETLNLTINNSETETFNVTECDSYTWHGHVYDESGIYNYNTTTASGCMLTEILNLTINNSESETVNITECDSYTWHGQNYTESGVYNYQTTTAQGCTHTETLNLTINESENVAFSETACDSYTWHGQTYTQSGSYPYETTTAAGCPHIETLNLTITNSTTESLSATECDEYTWHGTTYTQSGTYTFDTLNAAGCVHTQTLSLTINKSEHPVFTETSCDSYTWYGQSYTETGSYTHETTTAAGCPRIETLNLTINQSEHPVFTETSCDVFTWYGQNYTESGSYTHETTTVAGCERIETLNLTINKSENNIIPISSCTPYTWHGTTYSTSGNYTFDGTTEDGCSLHEVLQLTINSAITNDIYEDACESFTWTDGDGQTYTESGVHQKVFATSTCDSTVILHLTIHHNETADPEVVETCDSYEWNGTVYTTSGVYTYDAPLQGGCVRHETLNLTINQSETATFTETACDSYEWHGQTFSNSGYYTFDTVTAAGCPRSEALNLTINKSSSVSFSATACDEYIWHGQTYNQSGSYTFDTINAVGCTLTQTLNLTINNSEAEDYDVTECDSYIWHGQTYTQSGSYTYETTTAAGCQRIETLNLTINQGGTEHIYETACDNYNWYGITYTQSGVYDHQTTTESGCTLIEKLHLTINQSETEHFYQTECDSYTWYGENYTESGTYTHVTENAAGCTRTEYLHLIINKSEDIQLEATECDTYTWYGVNYTESGSYTHETTTAAGCERVETLNLTINKSENNEYNVSSCTPYEWHGQTYPASGNYTFNGTTEAGCNLHEVLHLTINSDITNDIYVDACETYTWEDGDGGTYTTSGEHEAVFATSTCDSTVILHLTIHHNESAEPETAEACGSYEWNGEIYTVSGTYTHETPLEGGCVLTETLNLTIYNNENVDPEVVTACNEYMWYDETYNVSGTYTHETQLETGCIRVETLQLTIVNAVDPEPEVVAICGEEYSWNDTTYTESGTYTHVTTLAGGCTITETLELTINSPVENEFDVTACDIYVWNNVSYTEDGDYTQTLTAANGCDSIVTIHLTLRNAITSEFDAEACDHYMWNNIVYANSGDFNQTFAAANGCDSVVTMHLTIKLPVSYEFDVEDCPGYMWNGSTYTLSGDYTQTFVGSNECDSVVTMHLTVKESPYSEFTMVACDSYVWDGIEYNANGNYSHVYEAANGCDSTVVMLLTINQSPIASITGDLWVATGVQDSTVLTAWGASSYLWSTGDTTQSIVVAPNIETTYYVTVTDENGCSSTAEVTVINSTGIGEDAIEVNIYPNPTKHVVYIEADGIHNIRVTDMLGQVLLERNESADRVQIDLSSYAAAQYFVQVYTTNGVVTRKIVKK